MINNTSTPNAITSATSLRMRQTKLGKKMDDRSVCAPLLAESDAQNNTTSAPHAASLTDADTVINTKIDSTQVEGEFCLEHANIQSCLPSQR